MYMKPKYTINKQFFISGFITWFRLAEKEETNITKTSLFKYTENFTTKKWNFLDKNSNIFFKFLLKT